MPFQLTYHSVASPGTSIEDIKEILEASVANNKKQNITGCLLFHNDFFLQVLEGEKETVLKLFDHIKHDSRHVLVTQLSVDETQSRIFDEWSMAFYHLPGKKELSSEESKLKEELLQLADTSKKANFTMKVFWYNVKNLLSAEGYYRINFTPA